MPLRVLLVGTGDFALPSFLEVYRSQHQVLGLVTQPDRVAPGRKTPHPHPVKAAAVERGTPVFQPENVNLPEALDRLRQFDADLFLVAAYGQILSRELLLIPRRGAYNLHASLLPKYRGAAPVQYAVWRGERETGVTMFRIEPRLDAGPIVGVVRTQIAPDDTSDTLEKRLAEQAAGLTIQVLDDLERGTTTELSQQSADLSPPPPRAPKLKKEQGRIDWTQSYAEIDCHIRAMQPWPQPYTFWNANANEMSEAPNARLLILKVCPALASPAENIPTGTVLASPPGRLWIRCGDGAVDVLTLQPPGKRAAEPTTLPLGPPPFG